MSFKTIDLKVNYESGIDDLIEDFYIPVLRESVAYDRIAGFFSSTSLAIAARGIVGLIGNSGKMRLIASPKLSEEDVEAMENAYRNPDEILSQKMIDEIANIKDVFERDHVYALGWLIANRMLEVKVAIVYDTDGKQLTSNEIENRGLFHQKVGILRDIEGNIISFSGSINETSSGWLNNVEEFKVFKYWEPGQHKYCTGDMEKFDAYWNNKRNNVKIVNLPEAVARKLINSAPNNISELLTLNRYRKHRRITDPMEKLGLFDYQKEAVTMWVNNDKKLICEMATGTGKTRTALGCMLRAFKENVPMVVFILCPQSTLSLQWKDEIEKIGIEHDEFLIADASNSKWKIELEDKLLNITLGTSKRLIVYTTHRTFSSLEFMNIVQVQKRNTKYMLIGDEAHSLGASKTRRGLINCYDYRLALSATPKRWYDDEGTNILYSFFGNKSFEFSMGKALNTVNPRTNKTYLINYYYYPIFTTLTDTEIEKYAELTNKISRLFILSSKDEKYDEYIENLKFKRANIHKSAENKYEVLENILDTMGDIQDLIIFVSPEQIDHVMLQLGARGIIAHKFTESEGTKSKPQYSGRSERQFLIDKFKEGKYQALVAIKCLDEGIDIPSAKNAVILASSTNPREYVQRIGRVIRQSEDKTFATIYDVIIKPDYRKLNSFLASFEKKIFKKEICRVMEIAENAINNAEACAKTYKILRG